MSLRDQINEDMKSAMRAKDSARLSAIRMLLAAIKQKEVDARVVLADAEIVAVVEKQVKQRRESAAQYDAGGRADLAQAERFEIEVLGAYLPPAMDAAELQSLVAAAMAEVAPKSPSEMGKVIAVLKPKVAGRADMGQVSALVKAAFGKV